MTTKAGSRLFAIAEKEFFDHIRSRKFLLIFGILLVVAIVGMIGGITEYNKSLDAYNEQQSQAGTMEKVRFMSEKPSILSVFSSVATYLVFIGGILGIAMGFDLISREKESKSLKILLSHPVYRDEVINGKALGGIAALGLTLAIVLVIALAALLICGILPDANEAVMIAVFGGVSFLLIFSYFAIALFMSTVCDESGSALIYTIIIFIALSVLVPTMADDTVMEYVIGSQPELPQELRDQIRAVTVAEGDGNTRISTASTGVGMDDAWKRYSEQTQAYWEKRQMAHDTLSLVSPTMNYETVTGVITTPYVSNVITAPAQTGGSVAFSMVTRENADTGDILAKVLGNIVALLLFPGLFFGLAYIRFMRLDVR